MYTLFNREYAWSPGYRSIFDSPDSDGTYWSDDVQGDIKPAVIEFRWEEEFDASQDETTTFVIPAGEIINKLGLQEKDDGYYYDADELVAFDSFLTGSNKHELLIRKDYVERFLEETSSKLFWLIVGEKQFFKGDYNQINQRRIGRFVFSNMGIEGVLQETYG